MSHNSVISAIEYFIRPIEKTYKITAWRRYLTFGKLHISLRSFQKVQDRRRKFAY